MILLVFFLVFSISSQGSTFSKLVDKYLIIYWMQLTKSYLLNKINGNKMGKNVLDKIFREHMLESMHL